MSNSIVRAVFETRLKTWADAHVPPLQIAFQSLTFDKPADGSAYLEPFLIPNFTLNREVSGDRKTLYGLFQVNVWTSGGSGNGEADDLSQGIVDLFPMIPKFSDVSVEQTPTVNQTRPDQSGSGWYITPVLIKYRYESSV